jgi:hypothetical protein
MSDFSERTGEQEMLAKLYVYTWAMIAALFLLFTVAGAMTVFNLVVFGFIAFGMVFMGMIAVLPSMVSHPLEETNPKAAKLSPKPITATIQHGAHSLRA